MTHTHPDLSYVSPDIKYVQFLYPHMSPKLFFYLKLMFYVIYKCIQCVWNGSKVSWLHHVTFLEPVNHAACKTV